MIEYTALIISIAALLVSTFFAWRSLVLARHSNAVPTLVDLFREHRGDHLAAARHFVYAELGKRDLSKGLDCLEPEERKLVRDLGWFYDNLGALVAHGIVEVNPVSGYLGGSVMASWEAMRPLVESERARRVDFQDPSRWQMYFENLYVLVKEQTPQQSRAAQRLWRLQS